MRKTINKKQKKVNPSLHEAVMGKSKKLKTSNGNKLNMETIVMEKIKSGKVEMKPRWYFVAGSILMTAGFVGLMAGAVFMVNLTIFLIRKRGPGYGRLEMMLDSFPLWVPVLAVTGIILGIWMLKKYDFSYKKNFYLIIMGIITSVMIAGLLIYYSGLNDVWSHKGVVRGLYQQSENSNPTPGWMKNGYVKRYNGN